MNNIKIYIQNILNSYAMKKAINELKPTFNSLKSNHGYSIIIMALFLDILLIPMKVGFTFITKMLSGFISLGTSFGVSDITMIKGLFATLAYASTGEKIQIILFAIISSIVSIIGLFVTVLYLQNGAFNSFKIYVEEKRVVSPKEFFKLCKLNIKEYTSNLITIVIIPLVLIYLAGKAINFIPFVAGIRLSNLISSILKYGLLFKMYATLVGLNGEEEMCKHSSKWLLYAGIMYVVDCVTTLTLITKAFNTAFILYTLLQLYDKNSINQVSEIQPEINTNNQVSTDTIKNENSINVDDEFDFDI